MSDPVFLTLVVTPSIMDNMVNSNVSAAKFRQKDKLNMLDCIIMRIWCMLFYIGLAEMVCNFDFWPIEKVQILRK